MILIGASSAPAPVSHCPSHVLSDTLPAQTTSNGMCCSPSLCSRLIRSGRVGDSQSTIYIPSTLSSNLLFFISTSALFTASCHRSQAGMSSRGGGGLEGAKTILADEGVRGLYTGYSSNIAYAFPADAIKFLVRRWHVAHLRIHADARQALEPPPRVYLITCTTVRTSNSVNLGVVPASGHRRM